jgi:hypothetical protein
MEDPQLLLSQAANALDGGNTKVYIQSSYFIIEASFKLNLEPLEGCIFGIHRRHGGLYAAATRSQICSSL